MKRSDFMIFNINDNVWKLKFVNPTNINLKRSDNSYTLGVTDNNVKTVYIANNLHPALRRKVLLHELTHVHAMEYNYYMPIEIEEIVADFMSLYGTDIVFLADDILKNILTGVA